jgi:hypothetical protein
MLLKLQRAGAIALREIAPSSWLCQKLNLNRTDSTRFYAMLHTSMSPKNGLKNASGG